MSGLAILQRFEAAAFALAFALVLWHGGADWRFVVAGLVLPDLSFAAYRWGPVIGARGYNAAHTYLVPALLVLAGVLAGMELPSAVFTPLGNLAMAWALHISVDRVLGFGLKLPTDFRDTHLGRLGGDD